MSSLKLTSSLSPAVQSIGASRILSLLGLVGLLVLSTLLGTLLGPVSLPAGETIEIVLRQAGVGIGHTWPANDVAIVWLIRVPRVVTAVLVGGALSLSGAIFQAVLRNPLADPFVIGTSSGAALGVSLAFALSLSFAWLGFGAVQVLAFIGAMAAVAIVLLLSRVGRRTSSVTVLLAGFAVSTLMIAAMWLVAYESGSSDRLFNWTMGSLADTSWQQLTVIGPLILFLAAASLFFTRDLNALLLGEEQSVHLGVTAEHSKYLLIGLAALLTALSVSVAGIIGFVGLVMPHIVRLLYGSTHQLLLPATLVAGGAYLCLADLAARTLAGGGGEMPLGILTAIIGAPIFLLLLRQSAGEYGF